MTKKMEYRIVVRRIGTDEIGHKEKFVGDQPNVERRASDIWSFHRFDSEPDIWRLKVFEPKGRSPIMTIG